MLPPQPIYCDYNSTTPVDPLVLEAMLPYFTNFYGNDYSKHQHGKKAALAVEQSQTQISDFFNCSPHEIYFTSGATESINLALQGIWKLNRDKECHILSFTSEHKATLDLGAVFNKLGYNFEALDVGDLGEIDLEYLESQITDQTKLISVMWVNNETGVIHDLEAISKIAKKHKVLLFCDATQAVGKIPIDLEKIPIDIMAFSGHKIYAPKGVGGLFLRKGLFLIPMLFGGNQQNGLRPGTANVPSIVGMGKAFEILANNFDSESKRLANLGDYFLDRATSFGGILNGSKTNRISQIINIAFEGIEANMMLEACANHFSAATGSACNSSNPEPSHVLQAMKLSKERIHESIRFSFGRFNNKTEVEKVLYAIQKAKLQLV